ncbi:MAG: beta-propeller domain-containing protein [Actinomycetota bacterium]
MRRILAITLLAGLFLIGCSSSQSPFQSTGQVDLEPGDIELVNRLVPFDSCDKLLSHLKEEASDRVGPYGLDNSGYPIWFNDGVFRADQPEIAVDSAMALDGAVPFSGEAESSSNTGSFTGTNVQELGVDEPDIIKTDGDRILVINNGILSYIAVNGGNGSLTDQIEIKSNAYGFELFIQGDRAFLLANGDNYSYVDPMPDEDGVSIEDGEMAMEVMPPGYYKPTAQIIEVDLSDPFNLEISGQMSISGSYLSARLVGDSVRMAVNSAPSNLEWVYPSNPGSEDRATRFNRELIEETSLEDWVPTYELSKGATTSSGPLLQCDQIHQPSAFAGFDVLSVLSFDLSEGLTPGGGVGVLASGQTVYSSLDRFYIATTKWVEDEVTEDDFRTWSDSYSTDIHAFSISVGNPAEYIASGQVDGSLLNQFSMDEYDQRLRIVTTTGSPWSEQDLSESQLIVMEEQGDALVEVGQVGGLGKGESLYSVRLLDEIGFAVTFRQIDPFYVLDLSDPVNPLVVGELKIPGFSTYLHPIDSNFVLGIGQNATDEGRILGLKVSAFDVSDPSNPIEVSTWTRDDTNSPAEYDHRAFQIRDRLVVLPVQSWNGDDGAVLLDIQQNGEIIEVGAISHEPLQIDETSDCEIIDLNILIGTSFEEFAEEFSEGGPVLQLCSEGADGGYGNNYCESIPVTELDNYFGELAEDLI